MKTVRQGLQNKVEVNAESTSSKPVAVLSLRKWATPTWSLGSGRPGGFRGKFTWEAQIRREGTQVPLYGISCLEEGISLGLGVGGAVGEVDRVAVGTPESQPWSLLIPRVLGPCCQGA